MNFGSGVYTLIRHALFPSGSAGPATARRGLALALVVPPFLILQAVHWVAFLVDDLLYRDFRDTPVREPLFVLGLPRSGTTTLHHVLAQDAERFATLRLGELLFAPAIVEKKIARGVGRLDGIMGRPLSRFVAWLERRLASSMDEIHPVSLDDPEEDYLLLLPLFATFILILGWPSHQRLWAISRLDTLPRAEADRIVGFYRECIQRHLYVHGADRQLLSKNPSFTPFIRALARAFPGARFVGCVRKPDRVVASQLSSLTPAAHFFGWNVAEPRYRDRIVDMLGFYADHMLECFDELPSSRCAFRVLSRWSADITSSVLELYQHFGWEPSASFEESLQRASERSRRHRSGHRYTLADFALDPASIHRRFAALEDRFEFSAGPTA